MTINPTDPSPNTAKPPPGHEAIWTFMSNHTHVLLCLAANPESTLRDVADRVGITERAVQRIVAELEEADYLERIRHGRRNRYKIHTNRPLRHPVEAHMQIGALLQLILGGAALAQATATPSK